MTLDKTSAYALAHARTRLADNERFFAAMRREMELEAATVIQADWRGVQGRREVEGMRDRWLLGLRADRMAITFAIRLQALYRGRRAREKARAKRARKLTKHGAQQPGSHRDLRVHHHAAGRDPPRPPHERFERPSPPPPHERMLGAAPARRKKEASDRWR